MKPINATARCLWTLDFRGENDAADLIGRVIRDVMAAGRVRTPDLDGRATPVEMGDAIAAALHAAVK